MPLPFLFNRDQTPPIKSEPRVKLEEDSGEHLSLTSLPPLRTDPIIKNKEKVPLIKTEQHVDTKRPLIALKQLSKQERRRAKKQRQRQAKKLRKEVEQLARENGNPEQPEAESKRLTRSACNSKGCLAEPKRSARASRDLEQPRVKSEQLDHSSRGYDKHYPPVGLERGIVYEMNDPNILDLFKRYSNYACWWETKGTVLAIRMTATGVKLKGRVTVEVFSHRGWRLEDERHGTVERYRLGDGWAETMRNVGDLFF